MAGPCLLLSWPGMKGKKKRSQVKIDVFCHALWLLRKQTNKPRKNECKSKTQVQFGASLLELEWNRNGTNWIYENCQNQTTHTHTLTFKCEINLTNKTNNMTKKKRNRCFGKTSSRVLSKTRLIEVITWRRLGRLCWRRKRAESPWWRGMSACWRKSCFNSSSWCSSSETTGRVQSNNPIRPLQCRGRPLRLNRLRRQWWRPPNSTVTVPSTTVKQLSTKTR